ncbi:hypothetical protein Tco_0651633 [Tanacetum coccineum]|uniref:Uncharacterized protein n=1 Tax=Tanacetum coccineum TaxID=301880 RepID=A0ABQ4WVB2_9ASTR
MKAFPDKQLIPETSSDQEAYEESFEGDDDTPPPGGGGTGSNSSEASKLIYGLTLEDNSGDWLSHPFDQAIKALKHNIDVRGEGTTAPCDICHLAKQTREPFPISEHSTTNLGEVVHLDQRRPNDGAETESEDGTNELSFMKGTEKDASDDESLGNPSEETNESTHTSHEDNIVEQSSILRATLTYKTSQVNQLH